MESVRELLDSWGISDEIKENFVRNGITIELLPKLNPETYKELCPHLGTRILLQEKVTELTTALAQTETISSEQNTNSNQCCFINLNDINITDVEPTTIYPYVTRKTFPNFDLETLLQTSAGGNSILKYYETFGFLDNSKRNQLTEIIIKHIYTFIVNNRITYEEYNVIAAKIITLFPKESIGTYFTNPIKKINSPNGRSTIARGKLVDIPKYYIINKIVLNQCTDDILFECFSLDIVEYNAHFRAYKVQQTTRSCTIAYRDLYTNLVSILYKVNLDFYVKVDF